MDKSRSLSVPQALDKNSNVIEPIIHSHNCKGGIPMTAFDYEARTFAVKVKDELIDNAQSVIETREPVALGEVKGIPTSRGDSTYDLLARTSIKNYRNALDTLSISEELFDKGILVLTDFELSDVGDLGEEPTLAQLKALVKALKNLIRLYSKDKKIASPKEVKKVFKLNTTVEHDSDSFGAHYYTPSQQVPNISYKNELLQSELLPINLSEKALEQLNELLKPSAIGRIIASIAKKLRRTA
jgi:hypothetical protein